MNSASETIMDRKRRYRERQKRGAMMVPIEASANTVKMLSDWGCLDDTRPVHRHDISAAIELLLDGLVDGELYLAVPDDNDEDAGPDEYVGL